MGRNANTIDLEAGLPWDPELWPKKSAQRMDLVSLESCGNHWRLAFWEAKLVRNSEARCQSGLPEVVEQLEKYQMWLEKTAEGCARPIGAPAQTWSSSTESQKRFIPKQAISGRGLLRWQGRKRQSYARQRAAADRR